MGKGRLEAFTDGVLAIVITIMVLETKTPEGYDPGAILAAAPAFVAYALSYVNVGIVWNNHHHIMQATERVNGRVLWANLLLLFWVSLIPLMIRWMNETHFAETPTAAYGAILALVTISYVVFERAIIACNAPAPSSPRRSATNGRDGSRLSPMSSPPPSPSSVRGSPSRSMS
jgi:TMEM175 potassium channel family protein